VRSKDVYKWEAGAFMLQPGDVLSFVGLCMWVECLRPRIIVSVDKLSQSA